MRKLLLIVLVAVLAVAVAGCEPDVESDSSAPESSSSSPAGEGAPAGDVEAMPTDGPGESAALEGLDASLAEGRAMQEGAGQPWPDLAGVEPAFTAYLLVVEMDGQVALFEVRADGIVHGLYAYQQAFDAGTLVWSSADFSSSPRAEARSEAEKAAVASVDDAMRDAFPDATYTVSIYGYRFTYAKDGVLLLNLEVATDGTVISVGS